MRIDWTSPKLKAYLEERQAMPFEYGAHDCCMFAAGAWIALGFPNPARPHRYTTERGAVRIMRKAGGLLALAEKLLGPKTEIGLSCPRGAIVYAEIVTGEARPILGLAAGNGFLTPASEGGLRALPLNYAKYYWLPEGVTHG